MIKPPSLASRFSAIDQVALEISAFRPSYTIALCVFQLCFTYLALVVQLYELQRGLSAPRVTVSRHLNPLVVA